MAAEQIRQIALQSSAKILVKLAEDLRYTSMSTPRSADDLESVIDEMAHTIAQLNNWKGVLTWLDGE